MRTFLVTGGAGFIGSHIAETLVRRGDRVRVLDNLSTGFVSNLDPVRADIEFVEGDVLDADLAAEVVDGVDCVFHEAALASVPRSMERPLETHAACVTGTLILLDAARRAGVRRLVYAASSSAYGDQPGSSKRETDLPAPISPYGAAKLAGESYCRAFTAAYRFSQHRQEVITNTRFTLWMYSSSSACGKQLAADGKGRVPRGLVTMVMRSLSVLQRPEEAGLSVESVPGEVYLRQSALLGGWAASATSC